MSEGQNQEKDKKQKKEQNQLEAQRKEKDLLTKRLTLGAFLLVVPLVLFFLLIELWPVEIGANGQQGQEQVQTANLENRTGQQENSTGKANTGPIWSETTLIFKNNIVYELRLLLLVLITGTLGSYIHAATSFSTYIGNRDFKPSWYWWYWLRLPIGAVVALTSYLLIKGSILVMQTGTVSLRPFCVMGFAALAGMFSKQAVDKLRELFDILFRNVIDETRGDKLKATDGKKKTNGKPADS